MTSLDPHIVRHVVAVKALQAEARAHARWFGRQFRDNEREGVVLDRAIRALKPGPRRELERLLKSVPEADTFDAMRTVISMAKPVTGLTAAERQLVFEARSYLYDAYESAAKGRFGECGAFARYAHERLSVLVDKRQRRGGVATLERTQVFADLLPVLSAIITAVSEVKGG